MGGALALTHDFHSNPVSPANMQVARTAKHRANVDRGVQRSYCWRDEERKMKSQKKKAHMVQ